MNLYGPGPQSTRALLAARPGEIRSHACPDLPAVRGPRWQSSDHEAHRWCHMLRWFGMTAEPHDILLHRPPRNHSYLSGSVLLHPGPAGEGRGWPVARFVAVARALAVDGHHVEIIGGPRARAVAEAIADAAGLPGHAESAGRAGLGALAGMVATARLVVCADIGVGRLAAAYATPSVHLVESIPAQVWGSPSWSSQRALWLTDSDLRDVNAIGVAEVLDAARELLASSPASFLRPLSYQIAPVQHGVPAGFCGSAKRACARARCQGLDVLAAGRRRR